MMVIPLSLYSSSMSADHWTTNALLAAYTDNNGPENAEKELMLITAPFPLNDHYLLKESIIRAIYIPSNHCRKDSTGHIEHGVDVTVNHCLAFVGTILYL